MPRRAALFVSCLFTLLLPMRVDGASAPTPALRDGRPCAGGTALVLGGGGARGVAHIGVDLVKSVFSVCAMDGAGHVQRRQDLGR